MISILVQVRCYFARCQNSNLDWLGNVRWAG